MNLDNLTAENYVVPAGEERAYHCVIEVKQFNSKTGKRVSVPRLQKFGKKAFESTILHALQQQGYEIRILHDPRAWEMKSAEEKAAKKAEREAAKKAAEQEKFDAAVAAAVEKALAAKEAKEKEAKKAAAKPKGGKKAESPKTPVEGTEKPTDE